MKRKKLTNLYRSFSDKPLHEQEEIPSSGKNLKDLYDGNEPMEIQYHEDQQLYYIEAEDIEAYVHGETVWATDPDRGMDDIEVNKDNSDVTSGAKGLPVAFKHKDAGYPASIKTDDHGIRVSEQGCTEQEIEEGTCGHALDGDVDVHNTDKHKPAGPSLMLRLQELAGLNKKLLTEQIDPSWNDVVYNSSIVVDLNGLLDESGNVFNSNNFGECSDICLLEGQGQVQLGFGGDTVSSEITFISEAIAAWAVTCPDHAANCITWQNGWGANGNMFNIGVVGETGINVTSVCSSLLSPYGGEPVSSGWVAVGSGGTLSFRRLDNPEPVTLTSIISDSGCGNMPEGCSGLSSWGASFTPPECAEWGECLESSDAFNTAIPDTEITHVYCKGPGCAAGNCTNDEGPGCTDPDAENYNPLSGTDDGSCEYIIEGCTDITATNYDPEATTDDGTCEYPNCGDFQEYLDEMFYNAPGPSNIGKFCMTCDPDALVNGANNPMYTGDDPMCDCCEPKHRCTADFTCEPDDEEGTFYSLWDCENLGACEPQEDEADVTECPSGQVTNPETGECIECEADLVLDLFTAFGGYEQFCSASCDPDDPQMSTSELCNCCGDYWDSIEPGATCTQFGVLPPDFQEEACCGNSSGSCPTNPDLWYCECCAMEGYDISTCGPEGLVEPDTADPEGMPNINTPGAPQPIDYKLGGADPQYLKDKAEFIRKWRNNQQARPKPQVSPVNRPNTQTALRENEIKRMQMLAGMFKKNNK